MAKGTRRVVAIPGDMARSGGESSATDEVRRAGFDLREPACVILGCVLHFVDAGTAGGIVGQLTKMLAPGSCLVISVGYGAGKAGTNFASTYNAQDGPRIYAHSWEQITGMFSGLALVPPGRRGRLPLAGGTADGRADPAVRHDRRRGGPSHGLMSGAGQRPRTWPGRRPGPSRRR